MEEDVEQEDAMFTEDAVDALLERLVDPLLHDLSKTQFPQDGEEPIARQLAALAWIYYYYLRKCFPSLSYWDSTELCRKAVVLRANLAHYHDVNAQTSLVRTKVLKACTAAQDVDALIPCVTRVAVFLLSSSQKQCLIVRSLITKSVWSLVETEVEGTSNLLDYALSAVQEHAGVDKSCLQVKNDFHQIRSMSQGSTCTRLYTMVCKRDVEIKPSSVVEEAVWIPVDNLISKTNCGLLETSGWGVTPALGIDYFHIRPLLEVLHQVLSSESNQTNSQEHVKPKSNSSGAIETAVTVDIAMDTRTNESEKRGSNVKLQVESTQRENVVHADESSKCQKKRGREEKSGGMLSKIRAFMGDQLPSKSPYEDQETQSNKDEARGLQERVENDDYHNRNINTMAKSRNEDIIVIDSEDEAIPDTNNTTKKLCTRNRSVKTNSRRQLTYNGQTQKELRASIRNKRQLTDTLLIKREHSEELMKTTKEQLAENKTESNQAVRPSSQKQHTEIEYMKSSSDQYVDTKSKTQLTEPRENIKEGSMNDSGVHSRRNKQVQLPRRNVANGTEVSSKKLMFDASSHEEATKGEKSDHITKPDVTLDRTDSRRASQVNTSLQQLQNKRKQHLQKVIDFTADYELHSACLQKDVIKCNAQINELLQESNGEDVSDEGPFEGLNFRDSLSKLRDPIQELDKFCLKNHWARPSYSIQATPHKSTQYLYTATVQLCGVEIEHSERGAASVDFQEAKQSAASTMLGRLYFFRARGKRY